MNGVVVYQSKWGNCRQVAEAIARGLEEAGHQVALEQVGSFEEPSPELDFVVVGGPTRIGKAYGPVKRFVKRGVTGDWAGKPFATFSTGASVGGEKPSAQASERLAEMLENAGLKPLAEPFKASVEDMHGPLAEGELDRAMEFGRDVGAKLSGGV